ncbi:MAG: hypothetical protein WA919_15515 [Coleofasciculaceae cyanobacterium]
MRQLKTFALTLAIWGGFTSFLSIQSIQAQEWLPIRGGINFGISGLAFLAEQNNSQSFLVVHDNKKRDQGRLAIVTIDNQSQPRYLPLEWPAGVELPIDLESVTAVPGQKFSFMASTSFGKVYYFRLNTDNNKVSIIKIFSLPSLPEGSNLEGFTLQEINGKLLAVWAHRGQNQEPAVIYWGILDLKKYEITPQGSAQLTVPWPVGKVRHISDLKVDSAGAVYITSATDNGDDGPFTSAVYVAGAFSFQSNQFRLRVNRDLVSLYRLGFHKLEALELVPGATGGVFLGTDDENMGSSIWIER